MALTSYFSYEPSAFQFSTGNYATINDAYTTPSSNGAYPDITTTGQPVIWPGSVFRIFDGVAGVPVVLRYVRYNPTANVALTSSNVPGLVYWKDATQTVVTGTYSENALGGVLGAEAGIMLNAGVTNGNWTIIQTGGILAGVNCPASVTYGDALQGGSATAFVLVRVAAATLASAWVPGIIALGWSTQTSGKNTVKLLGDSI